MLSSCWFLLRSPSKNNEPKDNVAKETTWDYWLLGSWNYEEPSSDGVQSEWPRGIETFYGNGDYENYAENSSGKKAIIKGTWKLDMKEEFVFHVKIKSVSYPDGTTSSRQENHKCTLFSLTPGRKLSYQIDNYYRSAKREE